MSDAGSAEPSSATGSAHVVTGSDPLRGLLLGEGERGAGRVEWCPPPYHVTRYIREAQERLYGRRFAVVFI